MRFAHTNIVARNAAALIDFYVAVFACELVPPLRELSEGWLAKGTGVPRAALTGGHLRLPGHGPAGPTLEVFQYADALQRPEPNAANRIGLGHLAFEVDDVAEAVDHVLRSGGALVGEIVSAEIAGAGCITFVYVADPEGNLIELQRWG